MCVYIHSLSLLPLTVQFTTVTPCFVPNSLKKVNVEEKQEKEDPMAEMLSRIRSGNVNLKKVGSASPRPEKKAGKGNVMAEMAMLLVSCMKVKVRNCIKLSGNTHN